MVLLLQYCGKYHFVTSHLFRNKAIGFNLVTVPGSAKSNIYTVQLKGNLIHTHSCMSRIARVVVWAPTISPAYIAKPIIDNA